MKVTRRTFVKTLSAGAALAALDGGGLNLFTSGVEKAFAATSEYNYVCKVCSGGCKGRAVVVDGVLTELKGEPAGQTGRGRLCVKGLSAARFYKSPVRVSKPLIRTNPKKGPGEDPGWRQASWNEAMTLITDKMKTAIETHGGKSIVLAYRPSPGDITNRLALSLGSPNDMCHHDTCYTTHDVAWAVTAHAKDLGAVPAAYVEGTDFTLDDAAGTITRVGLAAHSVVYVMYKGTDGKRYTDFVEFHTDTEHLSKPIDRAAKAPVVRGKVANKTGRNWTHDIARSKYILSFGWDMPGKAKNMMAQDYVWAINHGARAVVFEPRLSTTAALAKKTGGEWIPVKPGSDLAVMFAMAKVIVGNGEHADAGGTGRWNSAYCGTYAAPSAGVSGFKAFVDHIKGNAFAGESTIPGGLGDGSAADIAAVLAWAQGKSGVPAAKIQQIAEEFSTPANWPAYVPTHKRDAGGPNYRNSYEAATMTVMLTALVGSVDRLGGSIKQRQHSTKDLGWVCPIPGTFHLSTYERIDGLHNYPHQFKMNKGSYQYIADAILNEEPYPIDVVLLRKYNILSMPNPERVIEALNKVFVVCAEIQMSESAHMADVVLPELFWLEGRGFDKAEYFSLWPQLMITEGKVPKRFTGTADDATVAGSLPKGWRDILLTTFPKAFGTWVNPDTGFAPRELFRYNPGGTYDNTKPLIYDVVMTGDGTTKYGASKVYDQAILKKLGGDLGDAALRGTSLPEADPLDKTGGWEHFVKTGTGFFPEGLYPAPTAGLSYNFAGGTFPVPTSNPAGGSTFAPKYGTATAPVEFYSTWLDAYGFDPMPVWKERRQEKEGSFNLYMVTDHPVPHIHSTTQSTDFNSECYGEAVLWMNPTTAAAKGIASGDLVNVAAKPVASKGTGRTVKVKAFVTDRIKEDVVCFPHGWGHWSPDLDAFAKTGACDGEMIPVPPIAEIKAENTPQPGNRMTDVVLNVYK